MKYIVYKTTNLVNNYIYIGVHGTKNVTGFDLYLGCGVRINKPSTYEKGQTAFQQAVKQFGIHNFKRETIAIFDSAEEAYTLEGLLVNEAFLARPDVYNMILGGTINHAKGNHVYQYNLKTGIFEKEYTSCREAGEALLCSTQTVTRAIASYYQVMGVILSYVKVNKIDTTPYIAENKAQPVYRYLITGEFDAEFGSISAAGKASKISAGYVQKAAILGYSAKDLYKFCFCKADSIDKARTKYIQERPVYKYDTYGNFLQEYDTQKQAEQLNYNCNITKAIKSKTPDINGNYWALEKLQVYNKHQKTRKRKVAMLDDTGYIQKTWASIAECSKEVGKNVYEALIQQRKYKGVLYKYIED